LGEEAVAPLVEGRGHFVLDDAQARLAAGGEAAEVALFHLYNAVRARGDTLLLTARTPPARWPLVLPDLASRLGALPAIAVAEPDDALMARPHGGWSPSSTARRWRVGARSPGRSPPSCWRN
jgi:hypothetical protein